MRPPRVYKYPLDKAKSGILFGLPLPRGAQLLAFRFQGNVPTLWALIDPDRPATNDRTFVLALTGSDIVVPGRLRHVGTDVLMSETWASSYVLHLFEVVEE